LHRPSTSGRYGAITASRNWPRQGSADDSGDDRADDNPALILLSGRLANFNTDSLEPGQSRGHVRQAEPSRILGFGSTSSTGYLYLLHQRPHLQIGNRSNLYPAVPRLERSTCISIINEESISDVRSVRCFSARVNWVAKGSMRLRRSSALSSRETR